jgi:aryl-alcohol dehydrogenase
MGSSLAIFGAGAVGLSALLAAIARGCTNIIAIDINDERLGKAKALGATSTINSSSQDVVPTIMEFTGGKGVDFALDATGIPGVLRQAADALAVRGTVGLVGSGRPGTEACFETGLSITRGWSLRMIIEGDSVPQVFIPQLIDLWSQGRFPFDQLISNYPFADINKAFTDSEEGRAIKPVLVFEN